jgi:hypothetical protein
MQHVYGAEFYDYINAGSRRSAREIIPLLQKAVRIDSVLDLGAGQGAWAAEWLNAGVGDVVAVDGQYVDRQALLVPDERFNSHDLSQPLDLGRKFGLVQSLEVAEHIAKERAEQFVDTLTAHGDIVMFSAAILHQGGEHHVNEQLPEYWREKFLRRGFAAFDWLRPRLCDNARVEPWYRYNTVLYASGSGVSRLAPEVLAARVEDDRPLAVAGSLRWRARRMVVSMMPRRLVDRVASVNAARKARAYRGQAK